MNIVIKRILKLILVLIGIGVLLLVLFFGYLTYSMNQQQKLARKDLASQTLVCDSIQIVNDQLNFYLSNFNENIETLEFRLIRNNQVVSKNRIKLNSESIKLPFINFYKSDTILVIVENKYCYFISDFKYKPYLGYGMFGYAGYKDCRISDDVKINGRDRSLNLFMDDSLPIDSIPKSFR